MTSGSLSSCCVIFRRLARRSTWCWLSSVLCWSCMELNMRKARSVPAALLHDGMVDAQLLTQEIALSAMQKCEMVVFTARCDLGAHSQT